MNENFLSTQKGRRFEFLDGLRGIAALLVTCLHFHGLILERSSTSFPLLAELVFKNGYLGVQIFFVLSGFVISYSIGQQSITFAFILRFFLRRSIRLDPPYWIALLFLTGLIFIGSLLFNQGLQYIPDIKMFIINALYLPKLLDVDLILPVAWTLCLEFQFYLVFILLIKFTQHLNQWFGNCRTDYSSLTCILLFFPLFLLSLVEASHWNSWLPTPGLFLPYWYSFFFGCLTCWSLSKEIKEAYFWLAFLMLCLFCLIRWDAFMFATLATGLLIFIMAKKRALHDTLNSGYFQYLGKVSYSLYLIHWPIGIKYISLLSYILGQQINSIPSMALLLSALLFTLIATHFFYKFVELPSLILSKNIFKSSSEASSLLGLNGVL